MDKGATEQGEQEKNKEGERKIERLDNINNPHTRTHTRVCAYALKSIC